MRLTKCKSARPLCKLCLGLMFLVMVESLTLFESLFAYMCYCGTLKFILQSMSFRENELDFISRESSEFQASTADLKLHVQVQSHTQIIDVQQLHIGILPYDLLRRVVNEPTSA